ncbi:unnamed protein product [Linum trigynum]|uniref:Uncharacterized protein n=1 Tax=Linum trigynum TaxID=586398 RepID=A0AAV2EAA5_9ROSI
MQMLELQEWCYHTYENTLLYNERTKHLPDARLWAPKEFQVGDRVLLYNPRLKLFPAKHRSRCSKPFTITKVFLYGTIEISNPQTEPFKVNGNRFKLYLEGKVERVELMVELVDP